LKKPKSSPLRNAARVGATFERWEMDQWPSRKGIQKKKVGVLDIEQNAGGRAVERGIEGRKREWEEDGRK